MEEHRLGALLLENPVMREADLERCLEIQALTGGARALGQILIDEGLITQAKLDELLSLQNQRVRAPEKQLTIDGETAEGILRAAVEIGANELVLSEGRPLMVRVAGQLQSLGGRVLDGPEIWDFAHEFLGPDALHRIAEHRSVTQDFDLADVARGRVTAFRHFDGVCILLRIHPPAVRSAAELGLDARLGELMHAEKGLILLVGETRSGISETMHALLGEAVRGGDRLVLVLDEDLECPVPEGDAIVMRRRVGQHSRDYCSGLASAIGLDPDVVFVGDASRADVFDMTLRAAEAGRLVVAAMRARSVTDAIERILSFYSTRDVPSVRSTLASILRSVLALRLLPDAEHLDQRLVTETLYVDDSVREVLREGETAQIQLLIRLADSGMDHRLIELVRAGEVRFEDAFVHAEDKGAMLREGRKE